MYKTSLSRNVKESFKKILHPDPDLDHFQKLMDWYLAHDTPVVKFSSKSVHNFFCKVANRKTN